MNNSEKELMKRLGFKCQKCGYYDPLGKKLRISKEHKTVLCSVCNVFTPSDIEDFEAYLQEKIDSNLLETFRRFAKESKENNLKKGMIDAAKKGKIVSRPAFGYKMEQGKLVPADNADEVREIFEEFADDNSLNQIARNHNMSVNGIKKILRNFTYVGKVKFDNKILQGNHQPIITSELFNRVQQKIEKKKR